MPCELNPIAAIAVQEMITRCLSKAVAGLPAVIKGMRKH